MTNATNNNHLTRRGVLGTLGAFVGGSMMLNHGVAEENNPAAQVADRGAGVKITGMKTHLVQSKVYVEVLTNRGVTGWGEVSALVPSAAEALAKRLFELLDGENPTRIEFLWQKLFRAHRDLRGGGSRPPLRREVPFLRTSGII